VLQSTEPAPEQIPGSSYDNTANLADGASSPQQQQETSAGTAAAPAQTSGALPLEGHPAAELAATDGGGGTAAAAVLVAGDAPEVAGSPQQTVNTSARPATSSVDVAAAGASSVDRCNAELPSMRKPDAGILDSRACEGAHAAPPDAEPVADQAAEATAAPTLVSEADGQFEVLCRALLTASQLIATVRLLPTLVHARTAVGRGLLLHMNI
jgi:hypothetical protein